MKSLWLVLATSGLALTFVAAVVFIQHDRSTFVSPPEAVAESFVRQICARRYDRAMQYVHRSSGMSLEEVRAAGEALQRQASPIDNVTGTPGAMSSDSAVAEAHIASEPLGDVRVVVRLALDHGLWKVMDWTTVTATNRPRESMLQPLRAWQMSTATRLAALSARVPTSGRRRRFRPAGRTSTSPRRAATFRRRTRSTNGRVLRTAPGWAAADSARVRGSQNGRAVV